MKKVLTWALVLAPLVFLAAMVVRYRVDVPDWDQWALVPFLGKSLDGTLTAGDLWSQHNEHRPVVPRLAMIALARLSRWAISYELALSLLLAAGLFGVLAFGIRATFRTGLGPRPWWLPAFLSLTVFSLSQVENWLWGWNIQIVLNTLAGAGAIILLTRARLRWAHVLGAAGLAVVAAYSYASGLLFLIIGALLLLFPAAAPRRRKLAYLAFWGLLSAAVIASYLYHYRTPPQHPSLSLSWTPILQYVRYVLTYLGSALLTSDVNPSVALLAGAAGAVLFVLVLAMIGRAKAAPAGTLLPYLALSLYAVLTALLTGVGRAGFGELQAMSPRYIAFSSLFWISLVVLMVIALRSAEPAERRLARPSRALLGIILALIVGLTAMSSFQARILFQERNRYLAPARKALFTLENEELVERIYPHLREINRQDLERDLAILRKYRLSVFRSAHP